jgi:4-diphosphocytidyl-2-C-methyl-D-erythritol kinase
MSAFRALAPAKVNLGLFLGPTRASDAKHELVSVMQSISLADELTLEPAGAGADRDQIVCPGVPGPGHENLAAAALEAFRASTGWDAPPLRLSIIKRIPVAAGMAGGSADAAAALRLAGRASGLGDEALLLELAAGLGADVPAQVRPGRWLASAAGERLWELAPPVSPLGLLVLPLDAELPTAAVYGEADRLGLARDPEELERRLGALRVALEGGAVLPADGELLHNDLQRAAISLCPQIAEALLEARAAGVAHAFVSGSGPTVVGLFTDAEDRSPGAGERARRAAAALEGRVPAPLFASAVEASFARALAVGEHA